MNPSDVALQPVFPRRTLFVGLLLLMEYIFTVLISAQFLPDNLLQSGWSLSVLFWLVSVLTLPLSVALLMLRKPCGWYLLLFFLATQMLVRIVGLILELGQPTEVFHHPDSWGPSLNWGTLFLMKVLAWLFFTVLVVLIWRSRERTFFGASSLGQRRALWLGVGYAVTVAGYALLRNQ